MQMIDLGVSFEFLEMSFWLKMMIEGDADREGQEERGRGKREREEKKIWMEDL